MLREDKTYEHLIVHAFCECLWLHSRKTVVFHSGLPSDYCNHIQSDVDIIAVICFATRVQCDSLAWLSSRGVYAATRVHQGL